MLKVYKGLIIISYKENMIKVIIRLQIHNFQFLKINIYNKVIIIVQLRYLGETKVNYKCNLLNYNISPHILTNQ